MRNLTLVHYKLDHGGIDRVATILTNGLSREFNVTLLLFCRNGSGEAIYRAEIDKHVNIQYLGDSQSSRTKDLIRLLPKAVQYIKGHPTDILLSTCNNMNWITAFIAKRSKSKAKLIFKTTNPIIRKSDHSFFGMLRKWGYKKAFERADLTLTLSQAEATELKAHFPTSAHKFHNVINPYVTDEMLSKPDIKPSFDHVLPDRKIILSIGRFEPQKNMQLLIRSFAALKSIAYQLVILGDGTQKQECIDLIKSLGIEDNVTASGFVDNVADYLHAADLYIMTSRYEGLPAVIFEALAANCSILATNCFLAAREIIEPLEGCAILEQEYPEYIAHMMQKTLSEARSKSQNIDDRLSKVAQKYSIENGINDHIQKIKAIL